MTSLGTRSRWGCCMTSFEKLDAAKSFKSMVKTGRIGVDTEGWPVLAGRYGQVEYHDGARLAVYSSRARVIGRLRALGVRPYQVGDHEARFLFHPPALAAVRMIIKARRKRTSGASPEALARARAAIKPRKDA
jgi:hypothetical protein